MPELIEDYDLGVESVPCEPGAEEFAAIVRLNVDIGPALPYLNRTLRGAMYNAQAPSLAWKKGGATSPSGPTRSPSVTWGTGRRRKRWRKGW